MNMLAWTLRMALAWVAQAPEAPSARPPATADAIVEIEAAIDAGRSQEASEELSAFAFAPGVEDILRARLALRQRQFDAALRHLQRAASAQPDSDIVPIMRAHAYLGAEKPSAARDVLRKAKLDQARPAIAIPLARALDGSGAPAGAYDVLFAAQAAHPEQAELVHELVMLCARHRIWHAAAEWVRSTTPQALGPELAAAIVAEAHGDRDAREFVQMVASGFPQVVPVQAQLASFWGSLGAHRRAGDLLRTLAVTNPQLAQDATDHYRAAGALRDAMRANASIPDASKRAPQRFELAFEAGDFAYATIVGEQTLARHGLSPRRRYLLAYAHYALYQYAEATAHARTLLDTGEAARARQLLAAMRR